MFPALFVRGLSSEEFARLRLLSSSVSREEARRAEVILLSAAGKTANEISRHSGFHPANVKKWIRSFNQTGIEGIRAKKRGPQGGPKPKFSGEQIRRILELAGADPLQMGYRFRSWTPQKLADAAMERGIVERISHVTVRQILKRQSSVVSTSTDRLVGLPSAPDRVSQTASRSHSFEAGEKALAESRYEQAANSFQTCLDSGELSPEDEAVTRSQLSKALEELSNYEEAYDALSKYDDPRIASALSPGTRARLKLRLGWVCSFLRNPAKAIATLNEAKRIFLEFQDDLGMSEVHYALGRTYIEINEFRIARDHLLTAVGFQRVPLDRELLAQIYRRLGTVDFSEGAFSSSKEHYIKALALAEGSTNTNLMGGILLDLGVTSYRCFPEENQESVRYIKRAIEYLERGGHKDYLALAYNTLGDNLKFSGQWDESIQSLNRAIDVAERNAKLNFEATARITLAEVLCARGQFVESENHLNRSLSLIEGSGDKWLESNALRILAVVYRGLGRVEAALRTLRQTMQLSTSIGDLHGVTLAMVGLAEFHLSQGGLDQAREYLELSQGRLKEETYLPVSGLIQRLIGQKEAAAGGFAEARQHLAQSISIFTTTEIPFELARSHYQMGLLLKRAGDQKTAETHFANALTIFERLGAEPDAELTRKAVSSEDLGDQGAMTLRVSASNDVLLMQRLIEASGSRELLERELAAVIFENFSVEDVVLCSVTEEGELDVIAAQGIERQRAKSFCREWDLSSAETVSRAGDRVVIKLGEPSRPRIVVSVRGVETPNLTRLHPILKQAELGLELCSLRAAMRGSAPRGNEPRAQSVMPGFIVGSAAMFEVMDRIYKIRTSDVTVLITGESGTGKELVARHIHTQSARGRAIFLPFNCTATPKEIIDSQLFGHRRGAFTGATANYPGIIRAADGGTLFLDEIGDLALEVQPKLMRFLQEGEIQPLGETKQVSVDVRILAATNADLERAVEEGRFREDLFHRLNIIRIHVPPLRERREEIPVLAAHLLESCCARIGRRGLTLTQQALDAMIAYDWPGNVRQLRNEIERVVAYAVDGAKVAVTDLSPELLQQRRLALPGRFGSTSQTQLRADRQVMQDGWSSREPQNGSNNGEPVNLKEATAVLERQLILEALERNRNNLSRTASELGLSRRGLRLKLAQLGIPRGESEVSAGVGIRG